MKFRTNRAPIIPEIPADSTPEQKRFFKAIQVLLSENFRSTRQDLESIGTISIPIGGSIRWCGLYENIPDGFYIKDGSAKSRVDDAPLFAVLTKEKGTVTITIASPGVVTLGTHGFETGDCISLSTTGDLPGGLDVGTNYYVIKVNDNTFQLATTYANATATTPVPINTSGSQSGTHSLLYNPWGISGTTHFLLPDTRGLGSEGVGQQGTAPWGGYNYKGGLGQYKQDTMQGFRIYDSTCVSGGNYYPWIAGIAASSAYRVPEDDLTHGVPRIGFITAGPRVGEYDLIRAK